MRRDDINAVFGTGQGDVKKPSLLFKIHVIVFFDDQFHDRIVFDFGWKAQNIVFAINDDDIVPAKPLGRMSRQERNIQTRVFFTMKLAGLPNEEIL